MIGAADQREGPPATSSQLVWYSVSEPLTAHRGNVLQWQLLASVTSLRQHNRSMDVLVTWSGDLEPGLESELRRLGVTVTRCPEYRALLAGRVGADLLCQYPVLHKYVVMDQAIEPHRSQILLVDCDTLFLGDVSLLFDRYDEGDIVACPEVGSRRGRWTYDPSYLDEDALTRTASRMAAKPVAPFNTGVMLFNRGAFPMMTQLGCDVVEMALRLMAGVAGSTAELKRPELTELRARLNSDPEALPGIDPVPLPSANHWIIEEVALWLALGSTTLAVRDFDAADVALGAGVFDRPRHDSSWILGHYFTANTEAARAWWDIPPKARRPRCRPHQPSIPVHQALLGSPLVADHGGFGVYEDLVPPEIARALTAEALGAYWAGSEQVVRVGNDGIGRGAHPARKLVHSGGGPVQKQIYRSEAILAFLERICGMPVRPTGDRGSFNYYTRAQDFMGRHLDIIDCDLVILTVLQDLSTPAETAGAYRLFTGHIGVSLRDIGSQCVNTAPVVKVKSGQSLVLFGGLVPHEVLPVRANQARVVSAFCYRARPHQ